MLLSPLKQNDELKPKRELNNNFFIKVKLNSSQNLNELYKLININLFDDLSHPFSSVFFFQRRKNY